MIEDYFGFFEDYITILFMTGIIIGISGVLIGILGWHYLNEDDRPKMIGVIGTSIFVSVILIGIGL